MQGSVFLCGLLLLAGCNDSTPNSASNSNCTSNCVTVTGEGAMTHGSGKMRSEQRAVGAFTAIEILSAGDVKIARTGKTSLSVTGDTALLPFFTSQVKDGTLALSYAKGKSFEGKMPAYRITVADLRSIEIRGSARAKISDLDEKALSLTESGATRLHVAGRVGALTASLDGASALDASQLQAQDVKVVMRGASRATVNAGATLDATIGGAARLHYSGTPKITSSISGTGSLKPEK